MLHSCTILSVVLLRASSDLAPAPIWTWSEPAVDPKRDDALFARAQDAMLPKRDVRFRGAFDGVIVINRVLHYRGRGGDDSETARIEPMALAYSVWLARVAASAPAECANFTLCWMGGDGTGHPQACFASSAVEGIAQPLWYNFQTIQQLVSDLRGEHLRVTARDDQASVARKIHGVEAVPFEQREARAVWRGSLMTASRMPARLQLVNLSLARPDLLDAKWSAVRRRHGSTEGIPPAVLAPLDPIPSTRYYSDYQIVLVMSGMAAAFRTATHLASGQVVLLVKGGRATCARIESCDPHGADPPGAERHRVRRAGPWRHREWREWFFELLTPWEDYVPVDLDAAGELEAALRRLYGDAALRARISERARAFWAVHFGGFVEVGRRLACGLAAKQRALNFTELLSGSGARARVAPTGGRYGGATIDFSEFARRGGIG